jgi:replicative DNA helicase
MSDAPMTDLAAERAVLAAASQSSELYADVADLVNPNSFTLDSNQLLWKCLTRVYADGVAAAADYPTLLSAAKSEGCDAHFAKQEEREHLRAVLNMPVHPRNARKLAGRVAKLEVARMLDAQLALARSDVRAVTGDEPVDDILSRAEAPIFDLTTRLSSASHEGTGPIGKGARAYLTHLMDNPRDCVGIPTGFRRLDRAVGGGLRPNSMNLIAARPKTGKTWLVDTVGLNVAERGVPVLNLDTEMSKEEHVVRIAARMSGVLLDDIENGKCGLNVTNRRKVLEAADKLEQLPYHYRCISGEAFEETVSHMRRWVLREVGLDDSGKAKPCVIIYDYLKLMSADSLLKGNMAEYQMLGFIATSLKNFAARYGVPVLCFAQLNRDGIDREDGSVISQSDRLLWFCTSFIIFKKKTPEEQAEEPRRPGSKPFTHKLVPKDMRHGAGLEDGDYINLRADYARGVVEEGPTKYELARAGGGQSNPGMTVEGGGDVDFAA